MLRLMFLVFFYAVPTATLASSWSCTDVDSEARLGYDGSLTVVVQGDSNNKTCKFSIDGASTEDGSARNLVYSQDNSIPGKTFDPSKPIGTNLRGVDIDTFAQEALLRHLFSYLSGLGDSGAKALSIISSYADRGGGRLEISDCENGNEINFGGFSIFCQSFADANPDNVTDFQRGPVTANLNSAYYVFEFRIEDDQRSFFIVFFPSR